MSIVTADQGAFEEAYGTAVSTIVFATLPGSVRRVDALIAPQLIHAAQPALPVIKSRFGSKIIDIYSYAFDTDEWELGSTNSTINSKLLAVRWNYDLSIERLPGFTYLWLISPTSVPFSLLTTSGFYGVTPENGETAFFFSNDFGVYSISYAYDGVEDEDGSTWQGGVITWQGEAVTW